MKAILEFPRYAITKSGRVWSQLTGRWLCPGYVGNNRYYQQVSLWRRGKRCNRYVHRLVLEAFIGAQPKEMECRHLDGDPINNDLSNLKWGTRSENVKDSVKHKTHSSLGKFGEKHYRSKLSDYERRLIIYEYSTELFSQDKLAKMHEVAQVTVGRLVRGEVFPFCCIKTNSLKMRHKHVK